LSLINIEVHINVVKNKSVEVLQFA